MYESHYGLREKPFSLLPDPDFLYLGKNHGMALTLLEYGLMSQAGFTVITGEIGSGKTTLCRQLLNQLGDEVTVGLISNAQRSFGELLQWVLLAFGLDYQNKGKVELYQAFSDFLIEEYAKNHRTVLLIDEAQNLGAETLEELRMLSNINADKHQVLQMVLLGQPELRATLRRPELEQFAQRISIDFHLERLNEEETRAYIRHRLEVAGASPELFTDEACRVAFILSRGTPRIINRVCDLALVYGFAEQKDRIGADIMREVALDKARVESAGAARPAPAEQPAAQVEDQLQGAAQGGAGAVIYPHCGADSHPGHLLDILRNEAFKILSTSEPPDLGYPETLWTPGLVAELVWEQCGTRLNADETKQLLIKLGLETEASLEGMLARQDENSRQRWRNETYAAIRERARTRQAEILLCGVTEVWWGDDPERAPRTNQKPAATTQREGHCFTQLFAVDEEGGMVFRLNRGRPDSGMAVDFLERLLMGRNKGLCLICNEDSILGAGRVRAFARTQGERLQLFYLPPTPV